MPIPADKRQQLDDLIVQLDAKGASKDEIQTVVDDFSAKYGAADVPTPAPKEPGMGDTLSAAFTQATAPDRAVASALGNGAVGFAKGAGQTFVDLGKLIHQIPGVSAGVDALYGDPGASKRSFSEADQMMQPEGTAQKVGKVGERAAEMLIPGGQIDALAAKAPGILKLGARMAGNSALGAADAGLHGENVKAASIAGAALPAAGAVLGKVGEFAGEMAPSFVRAGIKPTVAALKRITPGANHAGLDEKAQDAANFILKHKLTSSDKAEGLIQDMEGKIQAGVGSQPTQATQTALSHLKDLRHEASQDPVNGSRWAAALDELEGRLKEGHGVGSAPGGLSEDVTTTTMQPGPQLTATQAPTAAVPTSVTTRGWRQSVPADEALEMARKVGKFSTNGTHGELQGIDIEGAKSVERGIRDAVKDASPPSVRQSFKTQSEALTAKGMLDRAGLREGNRDVISLPIRLAAHSANPKTTMLTMGADLLRNNQVKLGVYADQMAKALASGDVATVGQILKAVGVAGAEQMGGH